MDEVRAGQALPGSTWQCDECHKVYEVFNDQRDGWGMMEVTRRGRTGEVAKLFRVDPKTVTRWAHDGKLLSITTPGGHKRFRKRYIIQLLKVEEPE